MGDPGELIRRVRQGQGVSQQSLARRAGTSQSAVSDIERGRVSPTFETVARLLLCLGHRLHAEAQPVPSDAPAESLMETQRLSPHERLQRLGAGSSFILQHRPAAQRAEAERARRSGG
jgi:transcriptional regulator with XRE-family HTH domain